MTCPDTGNRIGRSSHEPVIIRAVCRTGFSDNIPAVDDTAVAQCFFTGVNNIGQHTVHNGSRFCRDDTIRHTSVTVIQQYITFSVLYPVIGIRLIVIALITENCIRGGHFFHSRTARETAERQTGKIFSVIIGVKMFEIEFLRQEIIAFRQTYHFKHTDGGTVGGNIQRSCGRNGAVISAIPVLRSGNRIAAFGIAPVPDRFVIDQRRIVDFLLLQCQHIGSQGLDGGTGLQRGTGRIIPQQTAVSFLPSADSGQYTAFKVHHDITDIHCRVIGRFPLQNLFLGNFLCPLVHRTIDFQTLAVNHILGFTDINTQCIR